MNILITGGSGMVGRSLRSLLPNAYAPSSKELDLTNSTLVKDYFNYHKFDYVIHLAAYVGSLHDNIESSTDYFDNNILMNTLVTKYAYESGVKNFLGILSSCIYPNDIDTFPIKEDMLHQGPPHTSLMSYAYAKRSHAVQLTAYKERFKVNYNYLIPCNLFGIVSKTHEKRSHFINDLIFKIIEAEKKGSKFINLFGDGTPLRQFMLASDLARIIHQYVEKECNTSYNIAPNINLSVDEIAKIALKACNCEHIKIKYDSSKPNGQYRKDVDTSLFKQKFNLFKFTDLELGIKKIYEHYS